MPAPRLEVDCLKLEQNARVLVKRLGARGISVTGVTKAALGNPLVGQAMRRGGVIALGDSRQANLPGLRQLDCPLWLIRSPMMSEIPAVAASATLSCNTELDVIDALSTAAAKHDLVHQVILMIELGDRREGIMPADLDRFVERVLRMPSIQLQGVGANLACASGVAPDARNMGELSAMATCLEARFGISLDIVSGGNSANVNWATGPGGVGRINNLRLGEVILLGCEALHRQPVPGLHTDAFSLVAEVIESKQKPIRPCGTIGQSALAEGQIASALLAAPAGFTEPPTGAMRHQSILALGAQDIDPGGLLAPPGIAIVSASSDHLVIDTGNKLLKIGTEIRFRPNYSALLRAMTSPFVALLPLDVAS